MGKPSVRKNSSKSWTESFLPTMVILPFLANSSKSLHTLAIRCKQLGFKVCPEQLSVKPSDWASRDQSDHMAHQAISQDLSPTGLHLCCHRASKFFRCMNMSFFFQEKNKNWPNCIRDSSISFWIIPPALFSFLFLPFSLTYLSFRARPVSYF